MNNKHTASLLLILAIFLSNILFPVFAVVNIKVSYMMPSETYKEFSNIEESKQQFGELFKYITFRKAELSTDYYSQEDILHMKDVKSLFVFIYLLLALSLVGSILIRPIIREKLKARIIGSIASTVLAFLVGLSALLFSFDSFSTVFHKIFFRNDYWLLDPRTSNLIKFFPQENLQMQATFIILLVVLISVGQIILAWKRLKKEK